MLTPVTRVIVACTNYVRAGDRLSALLDRRDPDRDRGERLGGVDQIEGNGHEAKAEGKGTRRRNLQRREASFAQ